MIIFYQPTHVYIILNLILSAAENPHCINCLRKRTDININYILIIILITFYQKQHNYINLLLS